MTTLESIDRRLSRIERFMKNKERTTTWISEGQAMAITGLSKKSLQVMRKHGKIKCRSLQSGRKMQYDIKTIDQLFVAE